MRINQPINFYSSLLTLGTVIGTLAENAAKGKRYQIIPIYRAR